MNCLFSDAYIYYYSLETMISGIMVIYVNVCIVFVFFSEGQSKSHRPAWQVAWLNNSGVDSKMSTRKSAAGGSPNLTEKCPIALKS